jgi:hypothetical protein
VLEWPSDLASEAACALEHISEAWAIDVECDLIRVGSRAWRLRRKQVSNVWPSRSGAVLTLEFLGASELEVKLRRISGSGVRKAR